MARWFDGVDDYIIVYTNPSLEPQQVTVMCWFYAEIPGEDTTREIVHRLNSSSQGHTQYNLSWRRVTGETVDRLWSRMSFTDGTESDLQSGPLSQFVWYHGCATWDGTTHKLYVNGILVASNNVGPKTLVYTPNMHVYIGILSPSISPNRFVGRICEVRLYNRALSQEEIIAEMYRRTPGHPNLVLYLPLWERSGTTALDHSGKGNNGTIYGAIYVDDPPMLGGSMVAP